MSGEFNNRLTEEGPLIEPMERDSYPNGVPEEQKESLLLTEKEMLETSYLIKPFEKMPFNLRIQLHTSSIEKDEIVVDFSSYPSKPWIILDEKLEFELGKNVNELSYFLKNWDEKQPPHIVEIVKEIEALIMKSRLSRKMPDTHEGQKISREKKEKRKFNPKAIFILDKKTRMLIFLQKLTIKAPVDKQELSRVIKTINAEIGKYQVNSYNKIQMGNRFTYFFGNFERLVIIILCKGPRNPPFELLIEMNEAFMKKYEDFLEDYSKSDVIAFKPFSENVKKYLETYLYEEYEKEIEIQITELLERTKPEIPILKPMKQPKPKVEVKNPPEPKIKPEVQLDAKTVQIEKKLETLIQPSPEVPAQKPGEKIKFKPIIREEPEHAKPIKDLEPIIFDSTANDISKVHGYCLNFEDYREYFELAMENWSIPEGNQKDLEKLEKSLRKKLKSSSLLRALFISSNPLDPSVYKLWLKIGKIKKSEVRKSLTYEYLCFIESNINGKLTHLCWTEDNKEFTVLRVINDDPLHLQILFETTDKVKEWEFN